MLKNFKKDACYIIAEIGGNFTTYEEAVRLIDAAFRIGVDCVKLQTYRAETVSSKSAFFDMENTGRISQYDFFKKYEIGKELHKKVFDYIRSKGLDWFSTPSHQTDVDMLESLGVSAYKIGADDAVNVPFLKYVANKGLPVFLSTGMCTLDEIKKSVAAIAEEGNERIVIFHTVSCYPTHPEFANLNVIRTFQREFPQFTIGYSDHTLSPLACIAAVAIGARVIERHFTMDKRAGGPDHIFSSTPDEMRYIVESVRIVEKMLGSGTRKPFGPEVQNRLNNRKSVVAIRDIGKGTLFTTDNISVKRPGTGIEPEHFAEILNRRAARDIKEDELIGWKDIG